MLSFDKASDNQTITPPRAPRDTSKSSEYVSREKGHTSVVIIFTVTLKGHYLEFIHHLWQGAAVYNDYCDYVFVLPKEEWMEMNGLRDWPKAQNIKLRLLSKEDLAIRCSFPIMKRALSECKLIKIILDEYPTATRLFLPNLGVVMPFLPLFIAKGIKVDGILYSINIYEKHKGYLAIKEKIDYLLFSKSKVFRKIYLLNSQSAVDYNNRSYKTSRFYNLVDPVPSVDLSECIDLRTKLEIDSATPVFLHFGAMDERKGTLEILKAIALLKDGEKRCFIFAGTISCSIKDEFEILLNQSNTSQSRVILIKGFLPYDYLHNLCKTCDCILAPYLATSCSSGVIGYAAVFGKPLIGSSNGLMGELIRRYDLGNCLEPTPKSIAEAICAFQPYELASKYQENNSLRHFIKTLFT